MTFKTGTSILAAALLALATAAPASAVQTDRETTLNSATKTFAWTGDAATSVNGWQWWLDDPEGDCDTADLGAGPTQALDHCDITLVTLSEPGDLTVDLPEAGDGDTNDWDLHVYVSNEDGTAYDELGSSAETGGAEQVELDGLEAGSYLVIAVPYISVNGGYTGSTTFTPAPAT